VPVRFFADDRKGKGGLTLADDLFGLAGGVHAPNLPHEVEARWRLVETAWSLQMPARLLAVEFDPSVEGLFVDSPRGRINVTGCREALNGYQKGLCFYCAKPIQIDARDVSFADVDHFFPRMLLQAQDLRRCNFDGVWNLVLACPDCNHGVRGKFTQVPELRFLERLHRRNSYFIESHHPLRETLMSQTGATEPERRGYLQAVDTAAIRQLIHRWSPANEQPTAI
jgi:hypothetical protein